MKRTIEAAAQANLGDGFEGIETRDPADAFARAPAQRRPSGHPPLSMKPSSADCITVTEATLDATTSVEIVRNVEDGTFMIVVFRIRGRLRLRVIAEEIGPFGTVGELCHALRVRFSAVDAHRLWPPPL